MRWNLLKTYDKIYTIDLHGNSKKKETAPDGSADVNVFDIQQGVSINVFVKTGQKKNDELGQILHYDLFGKREDKYIFLSENSINTVKYSELSNVAPNYFFTNKNFEDQSSYEKGFSVNEIFPLNNVGIVTARDSFTIHNTKEEVENTINDFLSLDDEDARVRFNLGKDVRDWQVNFAKNDLKTNYPQTGKFTKICYRPFDEKWTFYTGKSKGFHCYPRSEVMQHFTLGENVGLIIGRQGQAVGSMQWNLSYITKSMTDFNLYYRGGGTTFPLYLYNNGQKNVFQNDERIPNLNLEIVNQIATGLGLTFTNEKEETPNTFAPIDLLDYIYAVLHSPTYREKYKEFLKIDFPRVPFPHHSVGTGRDLSVQNDGGLSDKGEISEINAGRTGRDLSVQRDDDRDLSVQQKIQEKFWQLVKLGGNLRQIHLLESPIVEKYITGYPEDGDNVVTKPRYTPSPSLEGCPKDGVVGNVYINDTQYFSNVPDVAWNFYIGGYQPAQKWLKDRKDRELSYEDILHYQKIIVALTETDRLMREIDEVEIE
jgi:predicted helicase